MVIRVNHYVTPLDESPPEDDTAVDRKTLHFKNGVFTFRFKLILGGIRYLLAEITHGTTPFIDEHASQTRPFGLMSGVDDELDDLGNRWSGDGHVIAGEPRLSLGEWGVMELQITSVMLECSSIGCNTAAAIKRSMLMREGIAHVMFSCSLMYLCMSCIAARVSFEVLKTLWSQSVSKTPWP